MSRTVAIIQARMGSRRFPGKMLRELGPSPILEWVVRRASSARTLDRIIVATSDRPEDDPIAKIAESLGVFAFRGSETDVLGRFRIAAEAHDAKTIVRICGDNPLIDPTEIDRVVVERVARAADYGCNHRDMFGSGYADGFGAEVLTHSLLDEVEQRAQLAGHREHVTSAVVDGTVICKRFAPEAPEPLRAPELRFDVDTPEDLERLTLLVQQGICLSTPAAEIIRQYRSHLLHAR
jgi:spore coat polysaccharide biosynthesis protein SpsF